MKELPGFEPGLQESEPCVLTNYTIAPQWVKIVISLSGLRSPNGLRNPSGLRNPNGLRSYWGSNPDYGIQSPMYLPIIL